MGARRLASQLPVAMALFAAWLALFGDANAEYTAAQGDLTELSLEELMNLEVTSVSKKPQRLAAAAAAVFVITQEDIRRSGATSIPEALRMVPGCSVARSNASQWAVTCRGFNGRFANKLLVLMDGRTLYTPLFSGVFWESQDTLLEDIERIEVIRGPGATLWGANAVNGIINIITKSASDTQGGLVSAGGGSEERAFGALRYGTRLDNGAYVRGYAKYFDRDGLVDRAGNDTSDDWHMGRMGFRLDWQTSARDEVMMEGDLYTGKAGQLQNVPDTVPPYSHFLTSDADLSGGYLLGRWQRALAPSSELTLQLYYDHTEREEALFHDTLDVVDFDLQHRFAVGRRHAIVWGLGYRFSRDELIGGIAGISLTRPVHTDNLFSAFVQDDYTISPERLRLTVGSKFEHNDFTGFEFQPNVRLSWTPDERHTVWGAISRAVRTPSRFERDASVDVTVLPPGSPLNPLFLPILVTFQGNPAFGSEKLTAYELGYRVQPTERISLDLATFYNDYEDLRSTQPTRTLDATSRPGALLTPALFVNGMAGHSYGAELAADWRPLDWWRWQLAYTFLKVQLHMDGESEDTSSLIARSSPEHQVSLRSSLDLRKNMDLDLWLRYADKIDGFGTTDVTLIQFTVPSYVTLDARYAWRPRPGLELSLVGQNLFDAPRVEFVSDMFPVLIQVERGVYGKIEWRF